MGSAGWSAQWSGRPAASQPGSGAGRDPQFSAASSGKFPQSEETVSTERSLVRGGNGNEVAAGVVVVNVRHPGISVSGDGNGTDIFNAGVTVGPLDSSFDIGTGQTLGVIQQTGELPGFAAAIGNP